jgi:hypothetical protein
LSNKTTICGIETFLVPRPHRFSSRHATRDYLRLNDFLEFHGYLGGSLTTQDALKLFQKDHRAPSTGNLNYQTCRALNSVRCAHPEKARTIAEEELAFNATFLLPPKMSIYGAVAEPVIHVDVNRPQSLEYELVAGRWNSRALRYCFVGELPRKVPTQAKDAVRQAFQTWENTSVVSFRETFLPDESEIRVLWTPGRKSDPRSPDPFYGPGDKVAVGYYPFPFSGELAGDLHFDTSETWSITGQDNSLDLQTVSLHEIGHCLGLGHSSNPASVMYSTYKTLQHTITNSDAAELHRKYVGI